MFYALALLLCLAMMFIVAAGSSPVFALVLWTAKGLLNRLSPRIRANFLFLLRTLPWILAALVTLGLVLPAFMRFEPRSSNEILGVRLLLLASVGALLVGAIGARMLQIVWATGHAQRRWCSRSRRLQVQGVSVPVYSANGSASPLLAVTGVLKPKIFVAQAVVEQLSPGELFAALSHELAHVSALDNLKQLLLKATALPLWLKLFSGCDALWLNASEIAADEGALAGGASALDLSSALVKVSRMTLSRSVQPHGVIAASHLLPSLSRLPQGPLDADGRTSVGLRVHHLRQLLEDDQPNPEAVCSHRNYWPACSLVLLVLCYALCLNSLLPWMHEILELLVR